MGCGMRRCEGVRCSGVGYSGMGVWGEKVRRMSEDGDYGMWDAQVWGCGVKR